MADFVELKEAIKKGNFSTVYKAIWSHKQIAVKKYHKNVEDFEWVRNRYARLLSADHENILKFYEVSESSNKELYLFMEYAKCQSLDTHIHGPESQKYSINVAIHWMTQCAEGLSYLHGLAPTPIFHGNVQPKNLFITDNARCLKIGELASGNANVSKHYIPPEARSYIDHEGFDDAPRYTLKYYSEKIDAYSFGIVLWEVLSRCKPFCENELSSFLGPQNVQNRFGIKLQPPLSYVADVLGSSYIKSIIAMCWDSDQYKGSIMKTASLSLSKIIRLYFGNIPTFEAQAIEHIDYLQLEEQIGRGGFGVVYKAKMNQTQLALKRIFVNDADAKKGIEREVKYLSSACHENIIKFYCTMEDKECNTLILMEYADCGSLHNYMYRDKKQERNYSYLAAVNWMHQLSKGVAYLHNMKPRPVIHRDLKPHNLLLANKFRTLKIADFGAVTEQATSKKMTEIGTPCYMAPEVSISHLYSEKCDVFSFGIVLWEVMAHKRPFYHLEHLPTLAIMNKISQGERPLLADVEHHANSNKLKSLMKNCWHTDPKKRLAMKDVALELGTDFVHLGLDIFSIRLLPDPSDIDFL
ncbi:cysteine-rich receptor-like protein kinase 42 [Drosophila novamexicana]|uniref:cysteine-rich receptor-like protein kinase 42 n=1 Tax=Drosophila novamexicana TaxID=47314 RepID=UPI0011E5D050|nr:cysteine-rich receptor-like protein kinase 42 [Drosophila novamexicana]